MNSYRTLMPRQSIHSFLTQRESGSGYSIALKNGMTKEILRTGGQVAFPYNRDLYGHFSCVNATSFSHKDARFLVSGGDDMRILIWDVYSPPDEMKPLKVFKAHQSNIFCAIFDSTNQHIISCGNDELIIRFDVEYSSTTNLPKPPKVGMANDVIMAHEASVSNVDLFPTNDNIFLSASLDGVINLYDFRAPSSTNYVQGTIKTNIEQNFVQFNPVMEHLFLSCDVRGGIILRDIRMCFNECSDNLWTKSKKMALMEYTTSLQRPCFPQQVARPDVSSIQFARDGRTFIALLRKHFPTLYVVDDDAPVCVFSAHAEGEDNGFKNSCTMKHGNFGGPNEEYFFTGSDDFNVYGWKLPPLNEMLQVRESEPQSTSKLNKTFFLHEGKQINVFENNSAEFILRGHRSIINCAIWHPYLPYIFSSGVEKTIKIHSPFSWDGEDTERSFLQPRPKIRSPLSDAQRITIDDDLTLMDDFSLVDEETGLSVGGKDLARIETIGDKKRLALFDLFLQQEEKESDDLLFAREDDLYTGSDDEIYLDSDNESIDITFTIENNLAYEVQDYEELDSETMENDAWP